MVGMRGASLWRPVNAKPHHLRKRARAMHRTVQTALTFFLIVSMTFQTSLGCWRTRSACCPPPCAMTCSRCRPVCDPCAPVCGETVVVNDCHPVPCDSAVAEPADSNSPVADSPTPAEMPAAPGPPQHQLIAPTPAEDPVAEAPPVAPSPVVEPTRSVIAPPDDLRASEPVQPAHDVAPAERGFDAEASREPMPMPSEPEPADGGSSDLSDLFGDPNQAPVEQPRDDSETAPADEAPADEATDSIDDLFGDMPAETSEAGAGEEAPLNESNAPAEEPVFDGQPQPADDEPGRRTNPRIPAAISTTCSISIHRPISQRAPIRKRTCRSTTNQLKITRLTAPTTRPPRRTKAGRRFQRSR